MLASNVCKNSRIYFKTTLENIKTRKKPIKMHNIFLVQQINETSFILSLKNEIHGFLNTSVHSEFKIFRFIIFHDKIWRKVYEIRKKNFVFFRETFRSMETLVLCNIKEWTS